MIPKKIHYVWVGGAEMPATQKAFIDGWRKMMPEWEYMEWNEDNFDISTAPLYVRQAYEARKYAFVSDYVRLWALELYGGVYLDTDVEVIRSFDELAEFNSSFHHSINPSFPIKAFIGFEESKAKTLGTNVIGCEPHCAWVKEMLAYYDRTPFIKEDSTLDTTPNSELIAQLLTKYGLVRNGKEQFIIEPQALNHQSIIHIYDYHHFSPITSTRVMRNTKDTYSIHHCYGSWAEGSTSNRIRNSVVVREIVNALIQIKRFILHRT